MTTALQEFTAEQQAAIETRSVSVALSAGAGCGKTFVLTERFLAHLEPTNPHAPPSKLLADADLHELIAITFTDRAAREMRDRIRKKCLERLQAAPSNQADYWLSLLRSLDTARVSTIHSFCGALLRSHAVEAGLDPHFVVIEQSQADTLLAETIEDVLREKLSDSEDPLYNALLDLAAEFGLARLQSLTALLLWSCRSADLGPWLTCSPQEIIAIWDQYRRDLVVPAKLQEIADSPAAQSLLEIIHQIGEVEGELATRRDVLAQVLPKLARSQKPAADLEAILQHARIQGDGGKKAWPDEQLRDQFKDAAETLRKNATRALKVLSCDPSSMQADAQAGLNLLKLVHSILEQYGRRKRELAWLDFNDLFNQARQLLTDPAHAELQQQMSSSTRLLLVDECQDTDPLQVELIKALCGQQLHQGKLFFVGDYKQSIYRFRGADPGVFRRLEQETPTGGQLPLSKNFRSQPAILNFVNALFCDVLTNRTNGDIKNGAVLDYRPLAAHREQVTSTPAVEFLYAQAPEDTVEGDDAGAKDSARRREAEFIARRIRHMIDQQEPVATEKTNDGQWTARPAEERDIAILFRALSNVQFYEEALRNYNIPYYLVGGHAFYAQQEIHDVVNFLRAFASPSDAVSLAGVLRSPIFALTDETLFWLAQHSRGLAAGLFDDQLPRELDAKQLSRVQFAAATLRHLRDRKDRISITELLNEALAITGYDAALLAEFMGERKLANLRKLIDQARAFDQSGVFGLADFIVQLSDFVAEMPREPLAATHPEGANVVRLMTIHQAKGLEFPIVFVPDINRRAKGNEDQAAFHPQWGPLVKLPARSDRNGTISGLDLYQQLNAAEDQAELIRLLYVATTRAADYLVLSGGLSPKDFESPSAPWLKLLAERFDLKTGQFIAQLPKDSRYHAPAVKMTTHLSPVDVSSESGRPLNLDKAIEHALKRASEIKNQQKSPQRTFLPDDNEGEPLSCPVKVDLSAQRRFSVSRLNGQIQSISDEPASSFTFADEDQADVQPVAQPAGVDLGILVHRALARIDFTKLMNAKDEVASETIRAVVEHCLEPASNSAAELVATAIDIVRQFVRSDRAQELAKAKHIHRELEFMLAWPPKNSSPPAGQGREGAADSSRFIQGFIDCIYQDATGHWHLIDYKTNQVSASNAASHAAQFEMQLGVYALAIEEILGKPPVELTVHFLRPSIDHSFVWNSEVRQQAIIRVNQAIASSIMN